jgi:hypothetical protein
VLGNKVASKPGAILTQTQKLTQRRLEVSRAGVRKSRRGRCPRSLTRSRSVTVLRQVEAGARVDERMPQSGNRPGNVLPLEGEVFRGGSRPKLSLAPTVSSAWANSALVTSTDSAADARQSSSPSISGKSRPSGASSISAATYLATGKARSSAPKLLFA